MSKFEIWTEKYRPTNLSEVKGQNEIIDRLKAFIKSKAMPHLLFAGMQGTGKTTSFLAMAKELYGEGYRDNVLELNASDERGINIVRTSIKDFARTRPVSDDTPFKLIFLDEADALTKDAQHALRRMMEDYTSNVRFCLSCNYSSKIIPPIQSRCAIFRFQPIKKEVMTEVIQKIARDEKIDLDHTAMDYIYDASEGDLRKAENILQATTAIADKPSDSIPGTVRVTVNEVREVVSFAEPTELYEILKLALSGKFKASKDKLSDVLVKYGLSGSDAIAQFQKQIWNSEEFEDKLKVKLIKSCGEYDFRISEGSNEFIQINAFLADVALMGMDSRFQNVYSNIENKIE